MADDHLLHHHRRVVDVDDDEECMELPPGFRFHPTDEEIITHYLTPKSLDHSFSSLAMADVDFNKCEPWDLPSKAKMGEKEWYFFSQKDRKYPTGTRTNRATGAGYWKATGKDKEIYRPSSGAKSVLVGMKKTLVFYMGRAPKGDKTNWVKHEYRLHGYNMPFSSNAKEEWVVCRVFHKSIGVKESPLMPMLARMNYSSSTVDHQDDEDDDFNLSSSKYFPSFLDPQCNSAAATDAGTSTSYGKAGFGSFEPSIPEAPPPVEAYFHMADAYSGGGVGMMPPFDTSGHRPEYLARLRAALMATSGGGGGGSNHSTMLSDGEPSVAGTDRHGEISSVPDEASNQLIYDGGGASSSAGQVLDLEEVWKF